MNTRPVALVTGASRGIGKAAALQLAEAGFDVAITARTRREGEARSEPISVRDPDPIVDLPGSLETTAHEIEALGRSAFAITMDLLDEAQVAGAADRVLAAWGRIDVLVNNAVLTRSNMDRLLELSRDVLVDNVVANFVHQVVLTQRVVEHMVERGGGRIVNVVSGSSRLDPTAPAGEGGWGLAYAASKAAFGRLAGVVNAEFGPSIVAFNLDPGHVTTERSKALHPGRNAFSGTYGDEEPDDIGAVIRWLAQSEEALALVGKWIFAPKLRREWGEPKQD